MINTNATLNNTGTITVKDSGRMMFDTNTTLTNTGDITVKDSGRMMFDTNTTQTNTGTITLKDSSYIHIYKSTLNNTGTIDISNITDLSYWSNAGTFKLEGGSTFVLPKSIHTTNSNNFNITLNGTKDNPVNIVIPKYCEYITDINKTTEYLFNAIEEATGLTFDGNKDNVKFSW